MRAEMRALRGGNLRSAALRAARPERRARGARRAKTRPPHRRAPPRLDGGVQAVLWCSAFQGTRLARQRPFPPGTIRPAAEPCRGRGRHEPEGRAPEHRMNDDAAPPPNTVALPNVLTIPLLTVVSLSVFTMMALVFANVFSRYVLNQPIAGAEEVIKFLMGLTIFGGLPIVTWNKNHITVSLFEEFFRGRAKQLQVFFVTLCSVVALALICYLMYQQGLLLAEAKQITNYLGWPFAPIAYVMCGFAAVTLIIQLLLAAFLVRGIVTRPAGVSMMSQVD